MNIFVLGRTPAVCARSLGDKHCVKMPLETAQICSAVLHRHEAPQAARVYRVTHGRHPCVLWAGDRRANYHWTLRLFEALLAEYRFRYGREHACTRLLSCLQAGARHVPDMPARKSAQPLCMPEQFRIGGVIESYRAYYREKQRQGIVEYRRRRSAPAWLKSPGE